MQIKISKTLDSIISEVVFTVSKDPVHRALKDQLAVAILRREGSLAHQLLSTRLHQWQIRQIASIIEQQRSTAPDKSISPESFFLEFRDKLLADYTAKILNPATHSPVNTPWGVTTIHALATIALDPATATAQAIRGYGLSPERLLADAQHLVNRSISLTTKPRNLNRSGCV